VNLGGYLARMGHNVLLVDMDPQGNASSGLGVDIRSLNPIGLPAPHRASSPRQRSSGPPPSRTSPCCPPQQTSPESSPTLLQVEGREYVLKKALEQIAGRFDTVLIDCPPNLGILTLNALSFADRVLIPLQTEYFALEGLTQLLEAISRVQKNFNPSLTLDGVVLTMYDARTSMSQQVVEDVRRHFQDRVYQTIIPRNVKLSEALLPSASSSASTRPDSTGASAYEQLAREVANRG
jgi:chromosome partitioning protein